MARKSYREDDIIIDVAADQASMTLGALLDHKGYPRKSMKGLFDDKLFSMVTRPTLRRS